MTAAMGTNEKINDDGGPVALELPGSGDDIEKPMGFGEAYTVCSSSPTTPKPDQKGQRFFNLQRISNMSLYPNI